MSSDYLQHAIVISQHLSDETNIIAVASLYGASQNIRKYSLNSSMMSFLDSCIGAGLFALGANLILLFVPNIIKPLFIPAMVLGGAYQIYNNWNDIPTTTNQN